MKELGTFSFKRSNCAVYRVNVSYLSELQFGTHEILGKNVKRKSDLSPKLDSLKRHVLDQILVHEKHRGLQYYTVAWQTHQASGLAHLDILLLYSKNVKKTKTSFDYLLPYCPQNVQCFSNLQGKKPQVNIKCYSKSRLNEAIIHYGQKEDPAPLTNMTSEMSSRYLILNTIKQDPFGYLYDRMKEDPYNFNLTQYVTYYDLPKHISCWTAVKTKLNDLQPALIANLERRKPGIQYITRSLIQSRLTPDELKTFDSYECFQTIVDHLNQIPTYGSRRPHKTPNLYIWGPSGIGKTSLFNEYPGKDLNTYVPSYNVTLQNKYLNRYSNNTYGFISWHEFKYTDFTPNWVLLFLQGANVQIPVRYMSNIKRDNPLVVMTSNKSLKQHIDLRFSAKNFDTPQIAQDLRQTAYSNLINQRVTVVYVPVRMHFMQKLFVPLCKTAFY